jgi:hypothetical protein
MVSFTSRLLYGLDDVEKRTFLNLRGLELLPLARLALALRLPHTWIQSTIAPYSFITAPLDI